MGSFVGHIDEAIFFLLLALWWMYNKFIMHIRSRWHLGTFSSKLSYPLPGQCFFPLEAFLKTAFPVAGLIRELCLSEQPPITTNPDTLPLLGLAGMQRVTIYVMFICHGVIDILMSYKVPLPKGLDYISGIIAMIWYGLTLSLAAETSAASMQDASSMTVDSTINSLKFYVVYAAIMAVIGEMFFPHSLHGSLVRIYCAAVLGSWLLHVAFIGGTRPDWDSETNPTMGQIDLTTVNYMVVLFGFHLILQMCVIPFLYLVAYGALKLKGEGPSSQFKPLLIRGAPNEQI
jgi:hypothetical protein